MCHEALSESQLHSRWPHKLCGEVLLVEACLGVRCELEDARCSRVSGSEAMSILSWPEKNSLLEGKMSASRTLTDGYVGGLPDQRKAAGLKGVVEECCWVFCR